MSYASSSVVLSPPVGDALKPSWNVPLSGSEPSTSVLWFTFEPLPVSELAASHVKSATSRAFTGKYPGLLTKLIVHV